MSKRPWLLIVSLAVAVCLNVVFMLVGGMNSFDIVGRMMIGSSIGFHFAETVFVAVATVMLWWKLPTRLILGLAAVGFVAICTAISIRTARSPVPYVVGAVVVCQWLIYQLPLWWLRTSGWVLCIPSNDGSDDQASNHTRFGLQNIFVWTAIVSVFLAFTRIVSQFAMSAVDSPMSTDWSIFGILTLGNSILILPLIWAAFAEDQLSVWVVGSVIWAVILTPLELYILNISLPLRGDELLLFVVLNLTQVVASTILLLALRSTGLRMLKVAS